MHPIHTEAISYITASFDSIAYIFFFAAFLFYLKATSFLSSSNPSHVIPDALDPESNSIDSRLRGNDRRGGNDIWKNRDYIISIVFAALAFFTLEMTLVLPVLLVLYEYLFRNKSLKELKSLKMLKRLSPYFILALGYLFLRVGVFQITSRAEYLGGSIYLTFLTMVQAWIRYLELLIWPVNLSINPAIAPGINSWVGEATKIDKILSQSIWDLNILGGLGVLGGLVGLGIKLRKKYPLITFAIFWFFICLLPVSEIIPQGSMLNERFLYLPSFGVILSLVICSWFIVNKLKKHAYLLLASCLVLLASFYFYQTFNRNKDWHDNVSLW